MKKLAGAVNCRYLLSLLLSILFAFFIGAGILAVSGFHPLEAYGAMLSGAFDSARHIGDFLEYAMVLCVCGLACVLGARCRTRRRASRRRPRADGSRRRRGCPRR